MALALSDLLLGLRPRDARCAIADLAPDSRVRLAHSGLVTFHYVLAGKITVDLAEGKAELGPGDFALMVRGSAHELQTGEAAAPARLDLRDDRCRGEMPPRLSFGGGDAARVLSGLYGPGRVNGRHDLFILPELAVSRAVTARDGPLVPLWGSLAEFEQNSTATGARASILALSQGFIVKLVREAGAPDVAGLTRAGLARRLVEQAPDRDWTVAELARHAATSRSVLFEEFLEGTGRTPMQFLLQTRMDKAAALLRDPAVPIAEVARRCGYSSPAAFARTFRRERGEAPLHFRRAAGTTAQAVGVPRPTVQP